jgi:hypothetical protein
VRSCQHRPTIGPASGENKRKLAGRRRGPTDRPTCFVFPPCARSSSRFSSSPPPRPPSPASTMSRAARRSRHRAHRPLFHARDNRDHRRASRVFGFRPRAAIIGEPTGAVVSASPTAGSARASVLSSPSSTAPRHRLSFPPPRLHPVS